MIDTEETIIKYEKYLRKSEKSESTIYTYIWTIRNYYEKFGTLNKTNLILYKEALMVKNSPRTVSSRIIAINGYLDFVKKKELKLRNIKIGQENYLDNVISNKDYQHLKKMLKKSGYTRDYFLVWLICATGSRISEALQFTVQDVEQGYLGIYGKGNKYRRIYIPSKLQKEILKWLEEVEIKEGSIFLNKNKVTISARGVEANLRKYARKFKINPKDCHPHSFRHRFAINFLANYKIVNQYSQAGAIADLANILGHSSIATTQIYLRRTLSEQRDMVNKVVTW